MVAQDSSSSVAPAEAQDQTKSASDGQDATTPKPALNAADTSVPNGDDNRLKNTTAFLPVVYGSIAFYLGKKADEFQTHEWTLYVRGANREDLSPVISKVVFHLHPSFAQPTREYTQPPFEVTERGWGEFEAQIRIVWKDPTEKPTIVNHGIKLYPPGAVPNAASLSENAEPVVAEKYDEVVFTDPNETFFKQLTTVRTAPKLESSQQDHFKAVYNDEQDFLVLMEAQKFLKGELEQVKRKFQVVSGELETVDQALAIAQQKQREAAAKKSKSASAKRARPQAQSKKKS